MSRPSGLRRFVLIVCPILLSLTFIFNEIALVLDTNSEIANGYKRFVFGSLFFPFALGILLGHWYHIYGGRFTVDWRRFGKPLVQALLGAAMIVCVAAVGITCFCLKVPIPGYMNSIMVLIGIVFGMLVWPVKVFHN